MHRTLVALLVLASSSPAFAQEHAAEEPPPAAMRFPVAVIGAGLAGRGTRLRRHPELALSLVPAASRSVAGLSLRLGF